MAIFFSRTWQLRVLFTLFFANVSIMILGAYALSVSPALSLEPKSGVPSSESAIRRIEGIELSADFFYRLPEFFTPEEESNWWQSQDRVFKALSGRNTVSVEFIGKDGIMQQLEAGTTTMPFSEVMKKTWLVYLSGLIYMVSAVSVFRRHHSVSGSVLAFFLFFGGLYFISSAPIVNRAITLAPLYFKILAVSNYIASGGLITLVHFALVFPKPKQTLERYPLLPYIVFYGYFMIVTILYLSGIIAFATSTPFLFLWTFLMMGAFIHSIVTEKDLFLRKQIFLSFLAPLMVALIFILFNILPGILGTTSMRFVYFSLFSLILPFALPSAMDNLYLYQKRLEVERAFFREKERICQALHDEIGSNLMSIRFMSEVACTFWNDPEKAREVIQDIKQTALVNMERVKELLWAMDTNEDTAEDVISYLKSYSIKLFSHLDMEVEFKHSSPSAVIHLNPSGRFNLFNIYKETMTNIIKHSEAKKVQVEICVKKEGLEMRIADDGVGFDPEVIPKGCYGLRNMRKRAVETGGELNISSIKGRGTEICFYLPQKYLI